MKCVQCGKKVKKQQQFCVYCGEEIPKLQKTIDKKPPIVIIALCALLILSMITNAFLLFAPKKVEGRGFSSPEAAITAYVKALRKGDVEKMISTFAIESYVENYDLEDAIAFTNYYQYYNTDVGFPEGAAYTRQLNIHTRHDSVVMQIKRGLFTLTGVDNSKSITTFSRRDANYKTQISDFINQLDYPNLDKKLSRIEIGDILTEEDFDIDKNSVSNTMEQYLDVEEFRDIAIEIEFDGQDYYLFMCTAKIDGRWYNITPNGTLGLLAGANTSAGGFLMR